MVLSNGRVARFLSHRFSPVAFAVLAVILTLPALGAGLVGDDYFHRMILLGRGELGRRMDPTLDLFSFVADSQRAAMTDIGFLPWWSDPKLRIAFARPVTALTHQADYALWPDNFVLQHVHSLLWFGLSVGLVVLLFRRVQGATVVAGLAGLLFAVEDSHALPAGWLANRNALISLAGGTAVILLHLAWRKSGRSALLATAIVTLAVALGAGEATLGALAYVAAWEMTSDEKPWPARFFALLPYGMVVVVWRVLYGWGKYGTENSALYLDPGRQPLDFLAAFPERWTLLVTAQWFQAPVDAFVLFARGQQLVIVAFAALLVAGLVALLGDHFRRKRLARFWLLGMSLSLIPVCASFPMERLLTFAGIGAFGALSLLIEDLGIWPWQVGHDARKGWRRRAAKLLLFVHLPLAALLLVGRTALVEGYGDFFALAERQVPRGPEVANQTFVFVNGNDFPVVFTWVIRTATNSATAPRRVALLSSVLTRSEVTREDRSTLVVTSEGGFLGNSLDRLLGSSRMSFTPGQRIERPDCVAEVRELTGDGRPGKMAFHFRRDLEDPSYRWLFWKDGRVVDFRLPQIGESAMVSGPLFKLRHFR